MLKFIDIQPLIKNDESELKKKIVLTDRTSKLIGLNKDGLVTFVINENSIYAKSKTNTHVCLK